MPRLRTWILNRLATTCMVRDTWEAGATPSGLLHAPRVPLHDTPHVPSWHPFRLSFDVMMSHTSVACYPAFSRQRPSTASMAPRRRERAALTPDAWGAVARAALAAEADNLTAWARLSLVNRAWRNGLQGASSLCEGRAVSSLRMPRGWFDLCVALPTQCWQSCSSIGSHGVSVAVIYLAVPAPM